MRVTFARTVLSLIFFIAGLILAQPSSAQTLQSPGGPGDSSTKQPPKMQELEDAASFFSKGDMDNAEKSLAAAREKNPDLPPVELMMAQMFAMAKSVQGMVFYIEKAVQKNPDDPEAYVQLGELALQSRRITEADLLFTKAGSLMPKFNKSAERKNKIMPRIANGMASVAEVREDWPMAQQRLEEYLKLEPKNANVMQRIAKTLFQQKKAQESLEMLRKAAAVPDSESLTPEAQLALFYMQFGDPDNAKRWTKEALTKAPKDLKTRLVAASIYLQANQKGDVDEAKKQATEALAIDPKSLNARLLRGGVGLFQKDYAGAVTFFEQAVMDSPSNFEAKNNLALALVELKDESNSKKKRALEYAQDNYNKAQASQQNQQNPQAMAEASSTLAWVLYRMDPVANLENADKLLRQAVATNAYNPDTAYYAAVVGLANKRPEEAKSLLNRAMKSTTPWTMKTEAAALLEQLNKQ